jgi:uncharacterized protein (DUF433 family)
MIESMKPLDDILVRREGVMGGEVIFRDTRVPLKALFDYLAGGDSLDEFLEDFPGVTRESAPRVLQAMSAHLDESIHAAAS